MSETEDQKAPAEAGVERSEPETDGPEQSEPKTDGPAKKSAKGRRARADRPERRPIPIAEKVARGDEVARHILALIGLPDIEVEAREDDELVVVALGNEDTDGPLPLDSRTLESLQFVLNKAINRHADKRTRLNVEAPGFRRRRADGFEDIAGRLAEKTRALGKVITLGPLGHNEYRGFNAQLGKADGVKVGSVGGHDRRRLVIAPDSVDISSLVDGGRSGGGAGGGGGRRRRRRRRSKN